jgi:hypothetical protein
MEFAARLCLDGKLIIDNRDVHELGTDQIKVRLGGKHSLLIGYNEAVGLETPCSRLNT